MNSKRAIGASVVLAGVLVATGALLVRERSHLPSLDSILTTAATIVEPAPLAPHHRDVPELMRCEACHATASAIDDSKCSGCHVEVRDRIEARVGFHGTGELVSKSCATCHADHRSSLIAFDRAAFNHRQARFPLVGAHADLECEVCHEKPATQYAVSGREVQRAAGDLPVATAKGEPSSPDGASRFAFLGIEFDSCETCHVDPHSGTLTRAGQDCRTCHDEIGFTGRDLHFDHDRDSSFRLLGEHASLECAECHEPPAADPRLAAAKFRGLDSACSACHDDPHAGALTNGDRTCAACHDESGWTGRHLAFDHSKDCEFPLRGKHVDLACIACHEPARGEVATLPPTTLRTIATADFADARRRAAACASCHEDPHVGQFAADDCAACHQERGFRGVDLVFRHASVESFRLDGAHAALDCARCHHEDLMRTDGRAAIRFRGIETACTSCHDDPHDGSLAPKDCRTCHDTTAWNGTHLNFDHAKDSAFALDAAHATTSCATCHESKVFKPRASDCADCHATEAAHLAGRVSIVNAGVIAGASDAAPEMALWQPSPHSGLVGCAGCHDTSKTHETAADFAAKCVTCHAPRYSDLYLEQTAHLESLVAEARRLLDAKILARPDDPELARTRATIDAALRVGFHDYVPAEQVARRIRDASKDR